LFDNPRVLAVTASILGMLGLIPGMPNWPFLLLAAITGGGAWYKIRQRQQRVAQREAEEQRQQQAASRPAAETKELSWDDVPMVDPVGLEVGYRLIPLVDKSQGGELMDRIKGVRRKLSQELGFLIPPVHIRDNLDLSPTAYRITLMGVTVGEAEIAPDREMAINPGQVFGSVEGTPTRDPAFGLEAVWIDSANRESAQSMGYTVVDPNTVVATHLSQILQGHSHELLGHEEVQKLLEQLARTAPKLVEDLVPNTLPLGTVVKVLQNILSEGLPIRDMRTVAETLAENAAHMQDAGNLTAMVRVALGRMIVQKINGLAPELEVITLTPELEQLLLHAVQGAKDGGAGIEPMLAERLHKGLNESAQLQEMAGKPGVLLTSPPLRELLARFVRHTISGLHVLSYNEIPDDTQLKIVSTVGN
ncbi:MAG: FHIPEP family type III secretion protein, partial [Chromatiales bacterium]|nr:FHIPEP family type III secretion protein [Chromatiales bacterium]